MDKTFIIAEAGVNHNGDVNLALRMIDEAAKAGVDAIKFQTFDAAQVISSSLGKAQYQKGTTLPDESQLDMLKKLQLSHTHFETLFDYCRKRGLAFISSPFDLDSIRFLHKLGVEIIKIPSGEITNLPYLQRIGSLGKPIIMSTGMSVLKEIKTAIKILKDNGTPKNKITLLHCTTEYPSPYEDVNLRAMLSMKEIFNVPVGYSDHTLGIEIAIAAAALGAHVIEKHFTLDRNLDGPDHRASMDPQQMQQLVQAIRHVEVGLGDGEKKPAPSELKNMPYVRKSIVASHEIRKGDTFSNKNITVKRPGTGISPMRWNEVIGRTAKRHFKEDELIEL
jgi:N,N'-diacetyllegionaminate synthase